MRCREDRLAFNPGVSLTLRIVPDRSAQRDGALALEPGLDGPPHVGDPAELLQHPDDSPEIKA
jgi:hypothetical protein